MLPDTIRILIIILQSAWLIACVALVLVSQMKMYSDIGEKGWKVLIPFYGHFMFFKRISDGGTIYLLAVVFAGLAAVLRIFFPFMGVVYIVAPFVCGFFLSIVVARAYDKSTLFGVGLFFLPMIFYYNLAFDTQKKKAAAVPV